MKKYIFPVALGTLLKTGIVPRGIDFLGAAGGEHDNAERAFQKQTGGSGKCSGRGGT